MNNDFYFACEKIPNSWNEESFLSNFLYTIYWGGSDKKVNVNLFKNKLNELLHKDLFVKLVPQFFLIFLS
jgi:hypothetical protein